MSLIENIISKIKPHDPKGTIHVVDCSPLNWLDAALDDDRAADSLVAIQTRRGNR